uniref:Uncharacterized protein n=1 Tax=Anguilla anguilla TaxID=7936 RepID=A0A0E9RCZ5_ANGAN
MALNDIIMFTWERLFAGSVRSCCAILPFSILSDCCACGDCVGMGVDGLWRSGVIHTGVSSARKALRPICTV